MLCRAVAGLVAISCLTGPASAQSLEEVVARAIQARGGLEKIRAVESVRMVGHMTPPIEGAPEAAITLEMKRPRLSRFELTAEGVTGVQAYDGQRAWGIPPSPGAKPAPLPEEMAKDLLNQAHIDGPLVDHVAKGHKLALVGRETVDGRDAFRLEVRFAGGDVLYVLIDARSYLELRNETRRIVNGTPLEAVTRFSDYREAGGVLWPFRIEIGPKGVPEKQVVRFDSVLVNAAIGDERFRMPSR